MGQRVTFLCSNAELGGLKVRNRFVVSSRLGYIFARILFDFKFFMYILESLCLMLCR